MCKSILLCDGKALSFTVRRTYIWRGATCHFENIACIIKLILDFAKSLGGEPGRIVQSQIKVIPLKYNEIVRIDSGSSKYPKTVKSICIHGKCILWLTSIIVD